MRRRARRDCSGNAAISFRLSPGGSRTSAFNYPFHRLGRSHSNWNHDMTSFANPFSALPALSGDPRPGSNVLPARHRRNEPMIGNIILVDDDASARESLRCLLSTQPQLLIQSFCSGEEFLGAAADLAPGVLLLDFRMPGSNGLEVLEALGATDRAKFAAVIVTGDDDFELAIAALRAGAYDFMEKPYASATLFRVVAAAFSRLAYNYEAALQVEKARACIGRLSPRECEVLIGLSEGRANRSVAAQMKISTRAVEICRADLLSKLHVRSLMEALYIAFAAGLIPLSLPR